MRSKRSILREEKVDLSAVRSIEEIRLMNEWNECISGETERRAQRHLRTFDFNQTKRRERFPFIAKDVSVFFT